MALRKYTVASHSFGVFKNENQLNEDSLREYTLIKDNLKIFTKDVIHRISNLYNVNQFDATKTLNALMKELKELIDYEDEKFRN